MATFLSLVQSLARESGTLDPDLITTVSGLSDSRASKMVHWVQQAWRNIQNRRRDWGWLQATFTASITSGQAEYTPTALGIGTRFGEWMTDNEIIQPISLYDSAIGVEDEGPLTQIDYLDWHHRYGRGDPDPGRPSFYAIAPSKSLILGPSPDQTYTLRGIYRKSPQELTANIDVPEMPSHYHDMIWMEALRLLMIRDEAFNESTWPETDFARMLNNLERDYLPEVTLT